MIFKHRNHSWSLVIIRGHSCVLLDKIGMSQSYCDVRKRVELRKYSNVFKPVDDQSSDEEKPTTVDDVQDNGVGDDMQATSRRSTRNQRPVNRFGHSIPSRLIS